QHHSGSAAERAVVHLLVLVLRPVADVPGVDLNESGADRVVEQALPQVPVEDAREQRQHVEPDHGGTHSGRSRSRLANCHAFGASAAAVLALAASSAAFAASWASIA